MSSQKLIHLRRRITNSRLYHEQLEFSAEGSYQGVALEVWDQLLAPSALRASNLHLIPGIDIQTHVIVVLVESSECCQSRNEPLLPSLYCTSHNQQSQDRYAGRRRPSHGQTRRRRETQSRRGRGGRRFINVSNGNRNLLNCNLQTTTSTTSSSNLHARNHYFHRRTAERLSNSE